jgi:hypothetical protein
VAGGKRAHWTQDCEGGFREGSVVFILVQPSHRARIAPSSETSASVTAIGRVVALEVVVDELQRCEAR